MEKKKIQSTLFNSNKNQPNDCQNNKKKNFEYAIHD